MADLHIDPASAHAADLQTALALADAADDLTMRHYLSRTLRVETKPDRTPVTEADHATETLVRTALAREHSGDAVLGEEFGADAQGSTRCWIVDPIDGTANYLRGVPVWATLLALAVDGEPLVGVVSAPALGRRWWAWPGGVQTRDVDGTVRDLTVSAVSDPRDASVSYSDRFGWRTGTLDRLLQGVWRTRAFGDFFSHMLVAEGAIDLAAEPDLAPWDVAALIPIVDGAGGRQSSFDGGPALVLDAGRFSVPAGLLTSNRRLHDVALARLAD